MSARSSNRSLRWLQIGGVCAGIFGIVLLGYHTTGEFHPVVQIGVFTSLLLITTGAISEDEQTPWSILLATAVAIGYRTLVFIGPASLIGMDPDAYAVQVVRIAEAGTASGIDFSFYNVASLHFWPAVFAYRFGLSPADSLIVYPILVGATPLLAAAIVSKISPRSHGRAAVLAAVLTAGLAWNIKFGYTPIAQSTAVFLFLLTILFFLRYLDGFQSTDYLGFVLGAGALTYTHKLPIVLIGFAVVLFLVFEFVASVFDEPHAKPQAVATLALPPLLLVLFQNTFMTKFARNLIAKIAILVGPQELGLHRGAVSATHALPAQTGAEYILVRFGGALLLILLAFCCGLFYLLTRWRDSQVRFVLAATGSVTCLYVVGFVAPEVGQPVRIHFFNEVLLTALIAGGIGIIATKWSRRGSDREVAQTAAISSLVGVLLVSQLATAPVVPDYPDRPRLYLNHQEVDAKEWTHSRVPTEVHGDYYYALEVVPSQIEARADSAKPTLAYASSARQFQFQPMTVEYLNATLLEKDYDYIVYRTSVEIHRTNLGVWRLTWDPQKQLERKRSTLFSNGGVNVYYSD